MLDCKFLRYVVSMCDKLYCILSWPEIKLLECLITSPSCLCVDVMKLKCKTANVK